MSVILGKSITNEFIIEQFKHTAVISSLSSPPPQLLLSACAGCCADDVFEV
jgi:hypothetical protein